MGKRAKVFRSHTCQSLVQGWVAGVRDCGFRDKGAGREISLAAGEGAGSKGLLGVLAVFVRTSQGMSKEVSEASVTCPIPYS